MNTNHYKMAVDQSAEQNVGVVEMDTFLLAKILSNYKDYYECNVDGRIKWLGNLDELKKFVFSLLGDGKWRSPGGKRKGFSK